MLELIGIVIGIIAVLFAIWMALWATGLIKKGFQRTEGKQEVKPISKSVLKKLLLKLNKPKHPFKLKEANDTDLIVQWDVVDAKWIEILGKGWLNKVYKAWLLLDDEKKTVKYNEMIVEKSLTMGPLGAHGEASYFRGIQLWRKERGYRWGIRNDFSIGEVYNYKFNPSDVKEIVRQIANDNGWAFELVTTKGQASYRR